MNLTDIFQQPWFPVAAAVLALFLVVLFLKQILKTALILFIAGWLLWHFWLS